MTKISHKQLANWQNQIVQDELTRIKKNVPETKESEINYYEAGLRAGMHNIINTMVIQGLIERVYP